MRSDMPEICRKCMRTRGGRTCRRHVCSFIPRPNPYKKSTESIEFKWIKRGGRYVFVREDDIGGDKK